MNWLTQNKFLSGFLGACVLGGGALGYLVLTAKGNYETVQNNFNSKVSELHRLEGLKPFPEKASLDQFEVQKKGQAQAIEDLQKRLSANTLPVEAMSREQFQDKLREAAARVSAKAAQKNIKLPDKFFMAFNYYKDAPPPAEIAPALGRELKGLELVLDQLLDGGIIELKDLDRDTLPQEKGNGKAAGEGKAPEKPAKASAPGKGHPPAMVSRRNIHLEFISDQNHFRTVLNGLVASPKQFFIPRSVIVKNSHPTAPLKAETNVVDADKPTTLKLIFGNEKVEVGMDLEMVDFTFPAAK